jgi:hypothetical protein
MLPNPSAANASLLHGVLQPSNWHVEELCSLGHAQQTARRRGLLRGRTLCGIVAGHDSRRPWSGDVRRSILDEAAVL